MKELFRCAAELLTLAALPVALAQTETSSIYYLRSVPPDQFQLAFIAPDGTGDQPLTTGLTVPTFPSWAKDGSLLALTSVNPQRPSKISQDVFTINPVTGAVQLALQFVDQTSVEPVFSGGIQVGVQNRFSYSVPLYKAFSPDRTRLAVSRMVTSGFYQTQQPPALDQLSGTGQVPFLEVYNLADGSLQDLVLAGRQRTFFTLGGFGVDWHPTQNMLVAPIDVDSPTVGSLQPSESSTLFLIEVVPNAIELGRGRQLTHPQGSLQSSAFGTTFSTESDYAPAFSPDGQTVAYLRAENTVDTPNGISQHRPISVSIRAVNFDGTNDRLVLALSPGIFSIQVSWSPDGKQLVFDTGQQPAPQPLQLARLEAIPSTLSLSVVNADGSNPHLLRGTPAGMPAWQPALVAVQGPPLSLRLIPGKPPRLVVNWPALPQSVTLETAPRLGSGVQWTPVQAPVTSANGVSSVTVPIGESAGFLRLHLQ
jgi:hypothetical protein